MVPDTSLPAWTVGYLDATGAGSDPLGLADTDEYEVDRCDMTMLGDEPHDALVVDSRSLQTGGDDLPDAITDADPPLVVAISRAPGVSVPATALGVVDKHVDVTDSVEPLRSVLDEARERRWSNLGLSAEGLLDRVFDEAPIHLYVKDTAARHVRASHPYEKSFDLIGKTDKEAYPNDRLTSEAYGDDMHVIETGESVLEKEEYDELDGTWTVCSKVPLRDDDGRIAGLLGATRHITERKEAQEDLERQIERLEEFASILSHDLRNPLSVTLGRAELAHEKYPEDEHVESILRNVKRMGTIIEDVLTMTRDGQAVEETEPVTLERAARRSWENVETGEADLTVRSDLTVQADRSRLAHLFENLFANSIEHGGDPVSVVLGRLPDGDGFFLADDGPGIPPEDREQVFEQGYSSVPDGTGLGLNIVRQVVQAHGWSISVTESEDGGARFEVSEVEAVGQG